MNQGITGNQVPDAPFPGIEPYSYAGRELFFGRDAEARTLSRLIVIYRAVLLYAESGVGKSSLINSGIIPLAISEGFQPERIRIQPKKGGEVVIERISMSPDGKQPFLPSLFAFDETHDRIVLSVEEFIGVIRSKTAVARPLFIFDQFEEWFTLFEESSGGQSLEDIRSSKSKIRDAIAWLINDPGLPVKLVVSLREDYLAKISPLLEICHQLRDHCHRLTPLRGNEVSKVIRGPFEKCPGRFMPEIDLQMAEKIQGEFEKRMKGADVQLSELQIVCSNLFESGKEGKELDEYFTGAGVQGILEGYLKRCLDKLDPDQRGPAMTLLSYMVTSAYTRNVISRVDILKRAAEERIREDVARNTLAKLEQTKLVRREQRYDMYYYEIASEFLVDWICGYKEQAEKRELEQKKEAEKKELERKLEQEKLARRAEKAIQYRKWMFRLSVHLVLLVITSVLAVIMWIRAEKAKSEAVVARLMAEALAIQNSDPGKALLFAVTAADLSKEIGDGKDRDTEETLFRSLNLAYPLQTKRILRGRIGTAAFSPDGKRVATVISDDAQRKWTSSLWDVETLSTKNLGEESKTVIAMTFSPDGKRIAAFFDDGTFKVWDVESAKELQSLDLYREDHAVTFFDVAFSQDGGMIAASEGDGTTKVWDAASGKQVHSLPGNDGAIYSVAFSPDSKRVATAGQDGTARIWDIKTSTLLLSCTEGSGQIYKVAFSSDGKKIVSAGGLYVNVCDSSKVKTPNTFKAYTGQVKAIVFSPDGRQVAVGGTARAAEIHDLESGKLLFAYTQHFGPVVAMSYSTDGKYFTTIDRVGNLRLFETPGQLNKDYLMYTALSRFEHPMMPKECEEYLGRKICPQTVISLFLESRESERKGDFPGALESIQKAMTKYPISFFYLDVGRLHIKQGNKDEAVKAFSKAPEKYLLQELTTLREVEPAKADLIASVAKKLNVVIEKAPYAVGTLE